MLPVLALLHVAAISVAGWDLVGAPHPVVAATMAVVEVAAPPSDKVSPRLIEVVVEADVSPPSFEVTAAPPVAVAGGNCALTDAIGSALRDSPVTPVALAGIPVEARTVANALMMWDGHWAALPNDAGGVGLAQLRKIVEHTVASAAAGCRAAPVTGPRLIVVPEGNASIVLAFGSGTWAWSELLE